MIIPLNLKFKLKKDKKKNIESFLQNWVKLCDFDDDYDFDEIDIDLEKEENEAYYYDVELPEFENGSNLLFNIIKTFIDENEDISEIVYSQIDDNDSHYDILKINRNDSIFELIYRFNDNNIIYNYSSKKLLNDLKNELKDNVIDYLKKGHEFRSIIKNEQIYLEDILDEKFNDLTDEEISKNNSTDDYLDILECIIKNIENGTLNPKKNSDYFSINIMYILMDHPKFEDVTEEEMMDESKNSLYSKTESEILNRIIKYYNENNISYTYDSIEGLSEDEIKDLIIKTNC